jgi:hypothetical protein
MLPLSRLKYKECLLRKYGQSYPITYISPLKFNLNLQILSDSITPSTNSHLYNPHPKLYSCTETPDNTMDSTIDEYLQKVPVYQEEDDQAPSQSELESLKTLFSGDLSVQDCAEQLARRPTQPEIPSLTRQLRMSMLWSVIHAVVLKFPATQPRIVELLQEIRKSQVDEWSRLGTWGHKWADTMNSKSEIQF